MKRWKDLTEDEFERRISVDAFLIFSVTLIGIFAMAVNMTAGLVLMLVPLVLLTIDLFVCTQKFIRMIGEKSHD